MIDRTQHIWPVVALVVIVPVLLIAVGVVKREETYVNLATMELETATSWSIWGVRSSDTVVERDSRTLVSSALASLEATTGLHGTVIYHIDKTYLGPWGTTAGGSRPAGSRLRELAWNSEVAEAICAAGPACLEDLRSVIVMTRDTTDIEKTWDRLDEFLEKWRSQNSRDTILNYSN